MSEIKKLENVVAVLRSDEGCPWDREQTHESLKAACIEEAAEVICGINILSETGKADNLREELGDLLLQIIFHAQLASEEGLFNFDDVARTASEKMIRRHPHIFTPSGDVIRDGGAAGSGDPEEVRARLKKSWEDIKKGEKEGREWEEAYLPAAFDEAESLIGRARARKNMLT